jgi:hypothetical protein
VPRKKIRVRCSTCAGVFAIDGREAQAPVMAHSAPIAPLQSPKAAPAAPMAPVAGSYGDIALDAPAAAAPTPPAPQPKRPVAEPEASGSLDFEIERSSAPPTQRSQPGFAQPGSAAAPSRSAAATIDPVEDKSRRLARALVSDILVYNRDLRDKALNEGNLVQSLGVEIKKSWELYKERVTPEVANSNNHFREALNEILANGQKIF